MRRGERMKQSFGDGELLALVDLVARLRELQYFPWASFGSSIHGRRRELAALATLVGAGLMGAIAFVRGISLWSSSSSRRIQPLPGEVELELTVPGLHNWGNNCFLNAILQALASSEKFASYLRCSGEACNESEARMPSMPLSAALCDLLQELAEVTPVRRSVSPRHVMRVLSHYARGFDLGVQQDASEALHYLAANVQKERMEDFEELKPTLQSLAQISDSRKGWGDDAALQCWKQQLRWPMEGTYGSLLACSRCGFQAAVQFEFFGDLSLALPCTRDGCIKYGCTIEDCLRKFTMLERVSDFRCNRCAHLAAACYLNHISGSNNSNNKDVLNKLQSCNCDDDCPCELLVKEQGGVWFQIQGDAYKCLKIGRCPEVLCLHLKRVLMNNYGQLEKLMGHVSFSTELDLYPFTVSSQQSMRSKQSEPTTRSSPAPFDLSVRTRCPGGANIGDVLEHFDASPEAMECDHSLQATAEASSWTTEARCFGGADVAGQILEHCRGLQGFAEFRSRQLDVNPQEALSQYPPPDEVEMRDSNTVEEADVMEGCENSPDATESFPQEKQSDDHLTSDFPSSERLQKQTYELISVVVHYGSPMSGHYTVYRRVKVPRSSPSPASNKSQEQKVAISGEVEPETMWFEISDTHVVRVSEQEVLAARASMLFYELH